MKTAKLFAILLLLELSSFSSSMANEVDARSATVQGIALGSSLEQCNSAKGPPLRTERLEPADLWAYYPGELSVRLSVRDGRLTTVEVWGTSLEESECAIIVRGMSRTQVQETLGHPSFEQLGPKNSTLMVYLASKCPTDPAILIQIFGDSVGFIGISTIRQHSESGGRKTSIPGWRL